MFIANHIFNIKNAIYNRIIYEDDKIRKNREADSFIDEKNRLNII